MTTTSRQAHTPGPWTVDAANDRDGKVCIYHPPEDGRVLAQAWPDRLAPTFGEAQAIAMANARLIAKAPELFALLDELTKPAVAPASTEDVFTRTARVRRELDELTTDARKLLAEIRS